MVRAPDRSSGGICSIRMVPTNFFGNMVQWLRQKSDKLQIQIQILVFPPMGL